MPSLWVIMMAGGELFFSMSITMDLCGSEEDSEPRESSPRRCLISCWACSSNCQACSLTDNFGSGALSDSLTPCSTLSLTSDLSRCSFHCLGSITTFRLQELSLASHLCSLDGSVLEWPDIPEEKGNSELFKRLKPGDCSPSRYLKCWVFPICSGLLLLPSS